MKNVKKIFMEVIHNSNINFMEKVEALSKISKDNKEKFPELNMNLNDNTVQMLNSNKRYAIVLDQNRIIINFDDSNDFQGAVETFRKVLSGICEELNINNTNRIGIRVIKDIPFDSSAEASKAIKDNFIGNSSNFSSSFGTNMNNLHFGFSTEVKEYKVNHNLGVATNQQITIRDGQINTEVSFGVACDVDVYSDRLTKVNELHNYFESVLELIPKFMNKYQYIIKGE